MNDWQITLQPELRGRAQSPMPDLAMARADGSLRSLLARLSGIDVLVIDDWVIFATAGLEVARTDR